MLENEMVKTPETAYNFLHDLATKVIHKENQEYKELIQHLPESVTLTPDGKFYPWDREFTINHLKKNLYDFDEDNVSEYFPMENTITELLAIYTKFLNIEFKEEPISGLWHEDVKLITVYDQHVLRGYLLLDLHPRDGKYGHACQTTIIPALKLPDGTYQPAVGVVIANFPKPTATKPSLLQRTNVTTFFHEFGHALHAILGATHVRSFSGTSVKTDFVEMPSQMLEQWLLDGDILKQVSHHYKTGQPLTNDIINIILKLKNLRSGSALQRQLWLSLASLDYFNKGSHKNIDEIFKRDFLQL